MKACAAILLAGLLVGCAPAARVVLQADADGKVGRIEVRTQRGSQVMTQADTVSEVASATAAPRPPKAISPQEIASVWGQALAVRPRPPKTFNLYFHTGTADLTDESRTSLPAILAAAKDWQHPWIAVSGHADSVGGVEINTRISRQRAEAVREALVKTGVPATAIAVDFHGKGNPLVPTRDGVPEPRNRRVSVTIR